MPSMTRPLIGSEALTESRDGRSVAPHLVAQAMVRAVGLEPTRACAPRIFIPTTVFTATLPGVWGLDYPFTLTACAALGAARLVSTPSPSGAWLGIAIQQVSPNLSSSTSGVSSGALKRLSPMRLPFRHARTRLHVYRLQLSPQADSGCDFIALAKCFWFRDPCLQVPTDHPAPPIRARATKGSTSTRPPEPHGPLPSGPVQTATTPCR